MEPDQLAVINKALTSFENIFHSIKQNADYWGVKKHSVWAADGLQEIRQLKSTINCMKKGGLKDESLGSNS